MNKIILFLVLIFLISCTAQTKPAENSQIANPASVYCEEQGGTLDLASGICTLKDGTKCDEWAYFRKECPK